MHCENGVGFECRPFYVIKFAAYGGQYGGFKNKRWMATEFWQEAQAPAGSPASCRGWMATEFWQEAQGKWGRLVPAPRWMATEFWQEAQVLQDERQDGGRWMATEFWQEAQSFRAGRGLNPRPERSTPAQLLRRVYPRAGGGRQRVQWTPDRLSAGIAEFPAADAPGNSAMTTALVILYPRAGGGLSPRRRGFHTLSSVRLPPATRRANPPHKPGGGGSFRSGIQSPTGAVSHPP